MIVEIAYTLDQSDIGAVSSRFSKKLGAIEIIGSFATTANTFSIHVFGSVFREESP